MPLPEPVKTGAVREGIAWTESSLNKWIVAGGLKSIMLDGREKKARKIEDKKEYYIMNDVKEAYDEANEVITTAKQSYDRTLKSFRSAISNDLSSISGSANRVTGEVTKMSEAYKNAVDKLNSPEMEKAIQNAERLATALESISQIKPSDINLKLMGGGNE